MIMLCLAVISSKFLTALLTPTMHLLDVSHSPKPVAILPISWVVQQWDQGWNTRILGSHYRKKRTNMIS